MSVCRFAVKLTACFQELLKKAQERVSWDGWVICVRTYARPTNLHPLVSQSLVDRPDKLMAQTLKVLKAAGLLKFRNRLHAASSAVPRSGKDTIGAGNTS